MPGASSSFSSSSCILLSSSSSSINLHVARSPFVLCLLRSNAAVNTKANEGQTSFFAVTVRVALTRMSVHSSDGLHPMIGDDKSQAIFKIEAKYQISNALRLCTWLVVFRQAVGCCVFVVFFRGRWCGVRNACSRKLAPENVLFSRLKEVAPILRLSFEYTPYYASIFVIRGVSLPQA